MHDFLIRLKRLLIPYSIVLLFGYSAISGCQRSENDGNVSEARQLVFKVVDTDFSKGRLGFQQELNLQDLVRLHGHLCDGLIEGAMALQYGLNRLYPEGMIDRTNTRVVSRSSPCLSDAAISLTGARLQYGSFFVSDEISGLYIVGKSDRTPAILIKRRPGVKPVLIDQLGAKAVAGELSACALDSLKHLEDEYSKFLLEAENPDRLFEVINLKTFNWNIPPTNDFLKTDILNKNLPVCKH